MQAKAQQSSITVKNAIGRRLQRLLRQLLDGTGWSAKQLATHYQLPHRTVLNWLAGTSCPGAKRLKELCRTVGWQYDVMFEQQILADEAFEDDYLNFEKLTKRYLRLAPRDPVEAWGHVPLAGALVFVDLSAAGFICRAVIDHNFGTLIQFSTSQSVSLQVHVIFGRGLVISWRDQQGLIRETLDLTASNMNLIKNNLKGVAGL